MAEMSEENRTLKRELAISKEVKRGPIQLPIGFVPHSMFLHFIKGAGWEMEKQKEDKREQVQQQEPRQEEERLEECQQVEMLGFSWSPLAIISQFAPFFFSRPADVTIGQSF